MKKVHIGWIKYCTTSTSWPCKQEEADFAEEPWPCQSIFFLEQPTLEYNEPAWQYFWKKMYAEQ